MSLFHLIAGPMRHWHVQRTLVAFSSIPGKSEADVEFLRQYLDLVGHHPNQLSYRGRALVSTFAGEQCTFGQPSFVQGWMVVRSALESVCPVSPSHMR